MKKNEKNEGSRGSRSQADTDCDVFRIILMFMIVYESVQCELLKMFLLNPSNHSRKSALSTASFQIQRGVVQRCNDYNHVAVRILTDLAVRSQDLRFESPSPIAGIDL